MTGLTDTTKMVVHARLDSRAGEGIGMLQPQPATPTQPYQLCHQRWQESVRPTDHSKGQSMRGGQWADHKVSPFLVMSKGHVRQASEFEMCGGQPASPNIPLRGVQSRPHSASAMAVASSVLEQSTRSDLDMKENSASARQPTIHLPPKRSISWPADGCDCQDESTMRRSNFSAKAEVLGSLMVMCSGR